jgi:hypothetical protein
MHSRHAILAVLWLTLTDPGARGAETLLNAPATDSPFTLVAIGDTGTLTQALFDNALGVAKEIQKAKSGQRALVFLGDNFYEYGLSKDPIRVRERRFRVLYEDLFGGAMKALAQDGCAKEAGGSGGTDCPAGPITYVHAVAGNHDYYSGALSLAGVSVIPTGFSNQGNEYCRVRGLLTAEEKKEIEAQNAAPEAPPAAAQGAPAKPVKPTRPWHWRYHYYLPQEEYWPLEPGQAGSPEIHAIFFDSAFLVRAAENCGERKLTCPAAAPADEIAPDNPLSCVRAQAALCRLQEQIEGEKDHPNMRWSVFLAHHPFWSVGAHGGYAWNVVDGEATWSNQCSKAVDPQGWFKNTQFDPEDECSRGWSWYVDQIAAFMKKKHRPFDLAITGHDHSLQLLQPGDKDAAALTRLQIVAGSGCKPSVVRGPGPRKHPSPELERVYTAATANQGVSRPGFVALRFYPDRIHIQFFDAWRALPAASMAPVEEVKAWGTRSCFVLKESGGLDPQAECQW